MSIPTKIRDTIAPVKDAADRFGLAAEKFGDGIGLLVALSVVAIAVSSMALVVAIGVLREVRANGNP